MVIIDSRCNMVYSSFYIKGLINLFGINHIRFSINEFKNINLKDLIPCENDPANGEDPRIMLFIINDDQKYTKIAIDYRDKTSIYKEAYLWSDKYAKINCDKDNTDYNGKIISIPPSFSTPPYKTMRQTLKNALYNTFLNYIPHSMLDISPMTFFIESISPYIKREKLSNYKQKTCIPATNYIFFISSLWEKRNNNEYDKYIDLVNNYRIKYINALKNNHNINFEGGLFMYKHNDNEKYKDFIFEKRISHKEYVNKTNKSLFVFNTPAVWGCHGWKLGEFLAMGKAIISTPILRSLPSPLVHKENIHFVKDEKELQDAINLLIKDKNYREHLEQGAITYYHKFCSPTAVINYIINYKS